MKIKKSVVMVLVVFGLLTMLASTSFAAEFFCTVGSAGPLNATNTIVKLTDTAATPAFTDRYFNLRADRAKEMLAVALTAMANNKKVRVVMTSSVQWSTIDSVYLMPN